MLGKRVETLFCLRGTHIDRVSLVVKRHLRLLPPRIRTELQRDGAEISVGNVLSGGGTENSFLLDERHKSRVSDREVESAFAIEFDEFRGRRQHVQKGRLAFDEDVEEVLVGDERVFDEGSEVLGASISALSGLSPVSHRIEAVLLGIRRHGLETRAFRRIKVQLVRQT